ncbi:MAG: hypothetical protein QNJ37_21725 [Crocosphaera sp.]|nr:hypothetical protein [Crocosphaera sp.]
MNEPIITGIVEEMLKRIEGKLDKQSEEISAIKTEIGEMKTEMGRMNTEMGRMSTEIGYIKGTLETQQIFVQKIPDLAEKVGELKNWRQFVIITVTATVSGVIGWLVRGGNFKP